MLVSECKYKCTMFMYLSVAISPDSHVDSEHSTITPLKLEHTLLWSHLLKEIPHNKSLKFRFFSSTRYPSMLEGQIQYGITFVLTSVDDQQYYQ